MNASSPPAEAPTPTIGNDAPLLGSPLSLTGLFAGFCAFGAILNTPIRSPLMGGIRRQSGGDVTETASATGITG